jgi:hypothetical protein
VWKCRGEITGPSILCTLSLNVKEFQLVLGLIILQGFLFMASILFNEGLTVSLGPFARLSYRH